VNSEKLDLSTSDYDRHVVNSAVLVRYFVRGYRCKEGEWVPFKEDDDGGYEEDGEDDEEEGEEE